MKILLSFLVFFGIQFCYAQQTETDSLKYKDEITLVTGEKIICKIIHVTSSEIIFTTDSIEKKVYRDEVESYRYNNELFNLSKLAKSSLNYRKLMKKDYRTTPTEAELIALHKMYTQKQKRLMSTGIVVGVAGGGMMLGALLTQDGFTQSVLLVGGGILLGVATYLEWRSYDNFKKANEVEKIKNELYRR